MSAVSWRAWRLAFFVAVCAVSASRAETIEVGIDEARIMHLPQGATTLVIGNPLIADASLQNGDIIVITGKSFGSTNLIALDHSGRVLLERGVQVQSARSPDLVVVYRNDKRQSYSCAPECSPRITLGDDTGAFSAGLAQSVQRIGAAGVK